MPPVAPLLPVVFLPLPACYEDVAGCLDKPLPAPTLNGREKSFWEWEKRLRMNMKRALLCLLITLAAAALACNLPAFRNDGGDTPDGLTAEPEATEPPDNAGTPESDDDEPGDEEPTETPDDTDDTGEAEDRPPVSSEPPEFGDEVYSTDFRTRWVEVTSADDGVVKGRAAPTDGGMLFEVEPSWAMWVYSQQDDISSFYAEMIVQPQICPSTSTSSYGLMFHFRDNDNFRAFALTCSGGYRLYDYSASGDAIIASGELPAGVDATTGRHTIAVLAQSNTLALYVDGSLIDTVQVGEMPAGDLGPFVDTESEGVSILFEKLTVYEPG